MTKKKYDVTINTHGNCDRWRSGIFEELHRGCKTEYIEVETPLEIYRVSKRDSESVFFKKWFAKVLAHHNKLIEEGKSNG